MLVTANCYSSPPQLQIQIAPVDYSIELKFGHLATLKEQQDAEEEGVRACVE